jgi:hypothetical protein
MKGVCPTVGLPENAFSKHRRREGMGLNLPGNFTFAQKGRKGKGHKVKGVRFPHPPTPGRQNQAKPVFCSAPPLGVSPSAPAPTETRRRALRGCRLAGCVQPTNIAPDPPDTRSNRIITSMTPLTLIGFPPDLL